MGGGLTGSRLVKDGIRERGGHGEDAVGLYDHDIAAGEAAEMEREGGGRDVGLGSFPYGQAVPLAEDQAACLRR
jgi:hypothetical protein